MTLHCSIPQLNSEYFPQEAQQNDCSRRLEPCTFRILSKISDERLSEMGTINIQDIKLKVQNEQYSICRNPNQRLKSAVWDTMYSIKDENDAFVKGFVPCSYCLTVLKQASDGSTKNLMTHSRKCTENVTENFKQRRIGN
jgi:predicted DNA-binding protein (MmcQ/YjbR family)